MKKTWKMPVIFFVMPFFSLLLAQKSVAHFGMVIPSDSMVMQTDERTVTLTCSFSHPFEMKGMDLDKPKAFNVITNGKQSSLLDSLVETQVMGRMAWKTEFPIRRPGVYAFSMEPAPYWEPAEDCFIIHYTKTVVTAFEDDEGWDAETGMKTEIVPLSKPFGLYAGNVFQGVVKLDGAPVAHAEVEIEFYNQDRKVEAPTSYMITQTVKADSNGIFTYAAPSPGWWGFSALNTADFKLDHEGVKKDVELGAVIWVHFEEWKSR